MTLGHSRGSLSNPNAGHLQKLSHTTIGLADNATSVIFKNMYGSHPTDLASRRVRFLPNAATAESPPFPNVLDLDRPLTVVCYRPGLHWNRDADDLVGSSRGLYSGGNGVS